MPPPLPGSLAWQRVAAHSTVLDYHLSMLHDTHRMDSFRRAIHATVKPGDVVVDLGCGSGVLSFMACEAGAKKVYAIEGGPVIEVARDLALDNGFDDRIEFLSGWSMELGIPEPADVLISETIGNTGFDEGIVAWTVDARRRLLRPDAVILPQRLRMWVAPVESYDDHRLVSDWASPELPYDFRAAFWRAAQTLWFVDISPSDLLGQPELAADVDLRTATDGPISSSGTVQVDRDGVLHGLACWFDSLLCPGITVDNLPPRTETSWSHGFLPLPGALAVEAGDRFAWSVSVSADGEDWIWQIDAIEQDEHDGVAELDGVAESGEVTGVEQVQ